MMFGDDNYISLLTREKLPPLSTGGLLRQTAPQAAQASVRRINEMAKSAVYFKRRLTESQGEYDERLQRRIYAVVAAIHMTAAMWEVEPIG